MRDLPAPAPTTPRPVGFDASAFDATVAALRRRADIAGTYELTTEALQALLQRCPSDELRRRAEVLALLAYQYPRLGQLTDSMRCATEAVGLAERLGEDGLLAQALTSQSFVFGQLLMGREALESGLRALTAARRQNNPEGEAWALNRLGAAYACLENPTQACASTEQALEIATQAQAAEASFSCLNNLAYFWLRRLDDAALLGDSALLAQAQARAHAAAEQACALARQSASPFKVTVAVSNLVEVLLAKGLIEQALPLLNEFGHLAHDHGYRALALEADVQRAVFLRIKGEGSQAARLLEALLHAAAEPPPQLRRRLVQALYETYKACDQHRQALSWLEERTRLERQMRRDILVLQTEVIQIREQVEQAQARADRALADAQRERSRVTHLEHAHTQLRQHAMALDRAAHEDALTGLHNRRHADSALPLLVEGARLSDQVVTIAALDVDHFKRINDSHGHAVGDAVLQQLAGLLSERLRSADLLARIGGEEFIAVLVGIDPLQAVEICDRLRLAVAGHDWGALVPGLTVHISVGVAGGMPPQQAQALMARADQALYAAKRSGRNRVQLEPATP